MSLNWWYLILRLETVVFVLIIFKKPGFTFSTCGPFAKHRERIQKFKETGDLNFIYMIDSWCCAWWHKYLTKRTASNIVFKDIAYKVALNPF